MPPEIKAELRQSPKIELEAKKETSSHADKDGAKQVLFPAQLPSGKAVRKQESSVFAVRRSKRLNPELSLWLSFLDESSPDPAAPVEGAGNRAKEALSPTEHTECPSWENIETEAPAAEVEVSGGDEVDSGFQNYPMELQTPSPESSGESEASEMNERDCCTLLHQAGTEGRRAVEFVYVDIPILGVGGGMQMAQTYFNYLLSIMLYCMMLYGANNFPA